MSDKKIRIIDIVNDIRGGMDKAAFIQKYQLSPDALSSVLKRLVAAGVLQQAEVNPWLQHVTCPVCGFSQIEKFDECPRCGIIVSKYQGTKKSKMHPPALHREHSQPPVEISSNSSIKRTPPLPHAEDVKHQHKNCPYCGEKILAIAVKCKHCGEFLNGSLPSIQLKGKSSINKEKIIWEGHPSHLYYLGHYIIGAFLLVFFFVGIIVIIYAILDQKTKKFTITTQKITSKTGIISRNVNEVAIKDIRSINFKQSIIERLFELGSVEVGTAGTGSIEITFKGIPQPQQVKEMISKLKEDLL